MGLLTTRRPRQRRSTAVGAFLPAKNERQDGRSGPKLCLWNVFSNCLFSENKGRALFVFFRVAKMRFTSGISEFLHNESGLSVAQFCVVSLNFVTVCYGAVVLDPRRN